MSGSPIWTHRTDERRPGKYKSRIAAEGNRTVGDGVHFDEAATSMALATAVQMPVTGGKFKAFPRPVLWGPLGA